MAAVMPPSVGGDDLITPLELRFSCRELANLDTMSKSDPMVVVFMQKDAPSTEFVEIGRTEKIMNDLNPSFRTAVTVQYAFEKVQKLRFAVLDIDEHESHVRDFRAHDYIGEADVKLAAIASAPGMSMEVALSNVSKPTRANGFIRITAEEHSENNMTVRLQLRAHNLDKMDVFGKSDPFLVFKRLRAGSQDDWQPVHETEVIKKNLNPTWRPFEIPIRTLCGGDHDRPIRIECYDWDKRGSPDYIGSLNTTLTGLCSPDQDTILEFVNEKKARKKKKYRNSGILEVMSIELIPKPSFVEFLAGGMEINLIVGIDYTASNGNPVNPSSLHYLSPYEENSYESAMRAVGAVVSPYDHDQHFPVLGFGAKLPSGETSFCFPVAGVNVPVAVEGMPAVLEAYRNSLQFLALHGPTNFAPLINSVCELAETGTNDQTAQTYYILLILTDGEITDMHNTKEALVRAAKLPLSVIIVGVGAADFSNMELLDGDDVRLSYNGVYAERDIVQFVPFRDFESLGPEHLAAATLHEVPRQVVEFYAKHGIMPNPPRTFDPTYAPPPTFD